MNTTAADERLMIAALDGKLSDAEQSALEDYLEQWPLERASFEQLQHVDQLLRAEPVLAPPAQLQALVMRRVNRMPVVPIRLGTSQIVFLAGITGLILVGMGGGALALVGSLSPAVPSALLSGAIAIAHIALDTLAILLSVAISISRALLSRPATWLVAVGLCAIVAVWLRIIAAIYLPRARSGAIG
jgi:anti-sigma factor RsiW